MKEVLCDHIYEVKLMTDARNGIGPVLVFCPQGGELTEDTPVVAVYPFSWEEYTGRAVYGRFLPYEENGEGRLRIIREILILRHIVKKLSFCDDTSIGDSIYKSKKLEEEFEEGFTEYDVENMFGLIAKCWIE